MKPHKMHLSFSRLHLPFFLFFLIIFIHTSLQAQPQTPYPPHNQALFAPLDLPATNNIRTSDGQPGSGYWQQRADYFITATLNPATHRIDGTVTITYTNNSPHPLDRLWLQLDQNAFAPDSRNANIHGPDSSWRGAFSEGGFTISDVTLSRQGNQRSVDYIIDDTRMQITLASPLPPGGAVIDISMTFSFAVPSYGADRVGRMEVEGGTVYQIAQWYPRMAVYDDVNGWNTMPYLGQGEFYLEYGDFNLEITTPSDFVVVATGELLNPEEVYTADQARNLERARKSDVPVQIIRARDIGRRNARPNDSDFITWRFYAQNVRDVAWGASQAFVLDAAGWNNVLLMSAYPREAIGTDDNPGWERSTAYLLHTIPFYSEMWSAYPYPVAINVAGGIGGMEYPMLAFCQADARGQALFGVTDHEFGHTWFPMVVGNDERRYAWMDEGFNTFMNYYSNLAYYGPQAQRLQRYDPDYIAGRMLEPIADQPTMSYQDHLRGDAVGFLAYRKPAFGLLMLREHILGPKRFDAAFKSFIHQWAFKHPQPADFFRTMEQVSGEDLSWFWRGWFYGTSSYDPHIATIEGPENEMMQTIVQKDEMILPIDVNIEFTDGTTQARRIPVEAFFKQDFVTITPANGQRISRITIDPAQLLPDSNRSNNVWTQ